MQKRVECIVSGEVQGVSYRDFVRTSARRAGLLGSVQNLPDGTVEVVAEGEESVLREFLKVLKEGYAFAKVSQVSDGWSEATGTFSDFRILKS